MSRRRLHRAAPALLEASRDALRMLIDGRESDGNIRTAVVMKLAAAIDEAEEPILADEVKFTMTHSSYDALRQVCAHDEDLLSSITEGSRVTKQRVYVTLPVNLNNLRRLRTVMDRATSVRQTRRAFERMIEQLDRDVLNKSPLIHLAEASL